jgi:hypothetical protein
VVVAIMVAAVAMAVVLLGAAIVSGWSVHTTKVKTSPDGRWSLEIDTNDQGGLGGDTRVRLLSTTARPGFRPVVLSGPDWMPDWAVRWLDARTIMLNGQLEMPFVEHSIDTGSPATSGGAPDTAGYVRNTVAANELVVMLSGLSLAPPAGSAAALLTRRDTAEGLPWQELRPAGGRTWPGAPRCRVLAVNDRGELPDPRIATAGRLIMTPLGGRVEVRWDAERRWLVVHARLRRRLIGFLWEREVTAQTAAEARQRAARLWQLFAVERIPPG